MKEKNYITQSGLKKLQDELFQLLRVERVKVTETIAWAAANGDRSENADYIYGKKRLREIDSRVRFLSARIELAVAVEPEKIQSHKIQFGATVKIYDLEMQLEKTIRIVGVDEIDTNTNKLSWKSPLGSSLLGREVGDTILVKVPNGTKEYEVLEISYIEI